MPEPLGVILPAGGSSTRFGADKLLASLGGEPVLRRTVRRFLRDDVAVLVVATSSPAHRALLGRLDPRIVFADAGDCRARTVASALGLVPESVRLLAVHDAARPLVSDALLDRLFDHARVHGSAVPAMPVKLTIKQARGPLPALVQKTLDRSTLWEMQTPQVVPRASLARAIRSLDVPLESITDDAQLIELLGEPVHLVPGEERNLKLTTPQDLTLAEQLLG